MTDELNPTTAAPAPQGFDVEAWLQGAHLPEESVTVYQRADVVAELSDLKRRIELEDRVASDERTAGEAALTPLEQEYETLLQTFSRSALTVYVRALTEDELWDQRKATEQRTKDMDPTRQNKEFGFDLLSAAVVAVKPAGKERTPVKWSSDQVKALRNAIGDTQCSQILTARQIAQNAMPAVDADFLQQRSGTETGQA